MVYPLIKKQYRTPNAGTPSLRVQNTTKPLLLLSGPLPLARQLDGAFRLAHILIARHARDSCALPHIYVRHSEGIASLVAAVAHRPIGEALHTHPAEQLLAGVETGNHVDEAVPESLEREHEGGGVGERDGDLARVCDAVEAVGAGWDPGD